LRSLKVDSFRGSRLGLALGILIFIALLLWFFFAQVTLYEVSAEVTLNEDESLAAQFEPAAAGRIYEGQPAVLRIDAGPDQPLVTAAALVVGVDRDTGVVELLIIDEDFPVDALRAGRISQAEVEVEVEYITPAALVLRASGKYLGGSQLPDGQGGGTEAR
jgi:hypothetical protein